MDEIFNIILDVPSYNKVLSDKNLYSEFVIAFGDTIIGEAIDVGASDIHIEAFRNTSKVRYRTDGVLITMHKYA